MQTERMKFKRGGRYRLFHRKCAVDGVFIFCEMCRGAGERVHYLFRSEEGGYRLTFTDLSIRDVKISEAGI